MQISYARRGTGSPLVLVHGLGSRWQTFAPVIDSLAEHHAVTALDLPGFGETPALDTVQPGPSGYARWLSEWLTDNDIRNPHVVGSSMGGGVALELGRSGFASAVTAFSPVGFYNTTELRWVQGLLTGLRGAARAAEPTLGKLVDHKIGRAALLSTMFGHPTRVSPSAARLDLAGLAGATAFSAARDDFDNYVLGPNDDPGALPDIPVTIAWGTRDVVLPYRTQSVRAKRALPFARHVELTGCGHLPFNDEPDACSHIILDTTKEPGA